MNLQTLFQSSSQVQYYSFSFLIFFSLQCFDNRGYIQRHKKMTMKNTLASTHSVTGQNEEHYFSAAFGFSEGFNSN